MKTLMLAGLSTVLLAAGFKGAHPADPEGDGDERAIRSLIARMGEDWNKHDMKSFVTQVADDGDVVNRFGQRFRGRAKVLEHLTELHASPFRDHLVGRSSKVESVRFLTPDVAVAHEVSNEGMGESILTYVLLKKDGRWKVESSNVNPIGTPGAGPPPSR